MEEKPYVPPYDDWHADDPPCDDGARAAEKQDEAARQWPGLFGMKVNTTTGQEE
jgi:hypothetical protein